MSRLVTMPTQLAASSTTGTPEMLRARVSLSTSPMVVSGPDGERLADHAGFELLDLRDLRGLLLDASCSCG